MMAGAKLSLMLKEAQRGIKVVKYTTKSTLHFIDSVMLLEWKKIRRISCAVKVWKCNLAGRGEIVVDITFLLHFVQS